MSAEKMLDMTSDPHTTDAFDPDRTAAYSENDAESTLVAHPTTIGRYRVVRLLGRGGFGTVLLAEDDELKRSVAIKMPKGRQLTTATGVESFVREAQKAASLRHPSIVTIYDVGRLDDGGCFVVMEHVDGVTLSRLARTQRLSFPKIADLIAHVADGLAAAHREGVYHRDIKPGNILVDRGGFPRIVDFGLSIREEERAAEAGQVAGSLPYMSPEQVRGDFLHIDGRSDIWSLGVVLYELLTNQLPFWADDVRRTMFEITDADPARPRRLDPKVPDGLERVTLRCLCKNLEERFESADLVSKELRAWIVASGEGCWDPDAPLAMSDYELGPIVRTGTLVSLYSARQRSLGRYVTVCLLNSNIPTSPSLSRWFVTQCRSLAAADHADLVAVHGLGRSNDGGYFASMDRLTGVNLYERILAEGLEMSTALQVFRQVVDAVRRLRSEGVVISQLLLRDVFFESDGRLRVLPGLSHLSGSLAEGISGYCEAESILGPAAFIGVDTHNSRYDVRLLGWFLCALLLTRQGSPDAQDSLQMSQSPMMGSESVLKRLRECGATRREKSISRALNRICHKCLGAGRCRAYGSVDELAKDVAKTMRKLTGLFHS